MSTEGPGTVDQGGRWWGGGRQDADRSQKVQLKACIYSLHNLLWLARFGWVLWRLNSSSASSFFKACNSCVKRVFRLPVNTFTYLVEGHLNAGAPLLRNMVLGRYPTFYQILMRSPSIEVSLMAEMIAMGARSTTACNLAYLKSLTSLDCGAACSTTILEPCDL